MKAFKVKYLPQTNYRPDRLKVSCQDQEPITYRVSQFNPLYDPSIQKSAIYRYISDLEILRYRDPKLAIGQLDETTYVGVFHE